MSAQPERERDPGAFAEVAPVKMLRPQEVISFVRQEFDLRDVDQAQDGERAEE
jgi:hypothetical protein